jgi:hypothetical protein
MTLRRWIALGLGLMGFVYLLQGLGLTASLVESYMNNDLRWSLVGIVEMIAALFLWQRKEA